MWADSTDSIPKTLIRHVLCETQTRNGREKRWQCAVDFRKVAVDFRGTGACKTEEAKGPRVTDQTMVRPKTKRISNKLASPRPSPISF